MGCRLVLLLLAFAAGLTVAALGTPAQSQTPPGTWAQKAPMPAVRGEVAAAAAGDKLFALGGTVAGKAVPRNEEYDPATDRWRERAPLPQPRDHLGVAVHNGKITPSAASPPRCIKAWATSCSNMIPRAIAGGRSRP